MHLRRAWKKTNSLASPATSTGTITVDEAWAPRTLPSLAESTRCADWKTGQRPLYQTVKAKIYPPGLNTILGTAMFEFAAGLSKPGLSLSLPDEFHPYTVQSFEDANVIQPDYHGLR